MSKCLNPKDDLRAKAWPLLSLERRPRGEVSTSTLSTHTSSHCAGQAPLLSCRGAGWGKLQNYEQMNKEQMNDEVYWILDTRCWMLDTG